MDTDPTLRLRTSPSNQSPSVTSQSTNKKLPSSKNAQVPLSRPNRESLNIVDIFRFIAGAALVSTLGSYLVTSGESLIWGLRRPSWLSIRGLKSTLVSPHTSPLKQASRQHCKTKHADKPKPPNSTAPSNSQTPN